MPLAHGAGDPNVGQKVHLQTVRAVAFAGLATSAGHVEAEPTFLVAAGLRFGKHGVQLADVVEDLDVRRGVRARRAADRRLIDGDQLVEMLDAFDLAVRARFAQSAVKSRRKASTRMPFTSELLPEPETPVTQTNVPSGISASTFFRLLCDAPRIFSQFLPGGRRVAGISIFRLPEEIGRSGSWPIADISAVPLATTSPPRTPGPGPKSTM